MERKKKSIFVRRSVAVVLLLFTLCVFVLTGCKTNSSAQEPVIGIAWRADLDSEFYTNIVTAIERPAARPFF